MAPNSYGNKNLKPERSRGVELGANLKFLENRVGLDITYYWQKTTDAILNYLRAPSGGYLAPQVINVGGLVSRGIEIAANAVVLKSSDFQWNVNATLAKRKQYVTTLGGLGSYRAAPGRSRLWNTIKVGYQPGAVIAPVLDPNDRYNLTVPISDLSKLSQIIPNYLTKNGEKVLQFLGNQLPTLIGSFGMTFNLPFNLRFSTLFQGESGYVMQNETGQVRQASTITPMTARMIRDLKNPNTSTQRLREIANKYSHHFPVVAQNWIENGAYIKMQELSLSWQMPSEITSKLSAQKIRIMVSAHNLFYLSGWDGIISPGTSNPLVENGFLSNVDYFGSPVPRTVSMTLNITF